MRQRVQDSRGAKRRWGPHIASTWAKRGQNKGDGKTVLIVYGIETRSLLLLLDMLTQQSCNSTYRLRYAPKGARHQRSKATMRSAHLLPERSEGKTKVIRQQYLPFTVLKRFIVRELHRITIKLQQPLPFTVLKLAFFYKWIEIFMTEVETAPIVYSML